MTLRDPGNDNDNLLRLEKRIATGESLVGPRMKNSGFLEGQSPISAHDWLRGRHARGRQGQHAVVTPRMGYWGIKIYNSMNPDFVKPIAEEAHRLICTPLDMCLLSCRPSARCSTATTKSTTSTSSCSVFSSIPER